MLHSHSHRVCAIAIHAAAGAVLLLPALACAQTSPFLTGATALQTNILAWLTPIAVILVMVLGRHGDGKPNVLGLVYRRDPWHRDRLRRAADRDLGARHVRGVDA